MKPILNQVLLEPMHVNSMSERQWEYCIRQAQASKMTGRLYSILKHRQLLSNIPERVLNHLSSASIKAACQHRDILFEINSITHSLNQVGIEPIFLKGVAYVISDIANDGRTCNDVDILIAPARLSAAETQLNANGWTQEDISDYDANYYRQWMHELPPMLHLDRKTVLDVHHHILPKTVRENFDISLLIGQRQSHQLTLNGQQVTAFTLAPIDRLLHSAAHLFSEGEYSKGLRDLSDINLMFEALLADGSEITCSDIIARAEELKLDHALELATRLLPKVMHCNVSLIEFDNYQWRSRVLSTQRLRVLDWCFEQLLIPHHTSATSILFYCAGFVTYLRSHHLRMPLRLLLPHLTIKWWHGIKTSLIPKLLGNARFQQGEKRTKY